MGESVKRSEGGGGAHFTVLLGNVYCGGLCSPSVTHPHAPEVLAQVRPPTATRAGTRDSSTARQGCSFLSFSSWRLRRPLGALDPCGPPSLILFFPCDTHTHTHTHTFLHCFPITSNQSPMCIL